MEQREYVRRVLEAYRSTPGTAGVVRRADRLFAAQLYDEGVSLTTVENAFLLAAARRSARAADAPPPGTIRSLAYFAAVIGEVLQLKLARNTSSTSATDFSAPLPPDSSVRLPSIPQTSTGTRLRRVLGGGFGSPPDQGFHARRAHPDVERRRRNTGSFGR